MTRQPLYRYLSVGTLGGGGVRGGGVMKGGCRISRGGGISSLLYIYNGTSGINTVYYNNEFMTVNSICILS